MHWAPLLLLSTTTLSLVYMPTFQSPFQSGSNKRKSDAESSSASQNKRQAVADSTGSVPARHGRDTHWTVQWYERMIRVILVKQLTIVARRNPQFKKHKTWDFDGVVVVKGARCELFDSEDGRRCVSFLKRIYSTLFISCLRVSCGKPIGIEADKIGPDAEFTVGGKDVRVDHAIKQSEYMSGTCFSGSVANTELFSSSFVARSSGTAMKQFVPLKPRNGNGFKTPSFVGSPAVSNSLPVTMSSSESQNCAPSAGPSSSHGNSSSFSEGKPSYWYVNWRKPQQKKHKTWDGDAFLMHKGEKLTLVTEKGLM